MIRTFCGLRRAFSVNKNEMEVFNTIKGWWHPAGPMHILFDYNYHRVAFLKQTLKQLQQTQQVQPNLLRPLSGMKALDVGCGAGILAESLARLGANVLAVDPNPTSISEALAHKGICPTLSSLEYLQSTIQEVNRTNNQNKQSSALYDLVTSMEVVEHVDNPSKFVGELAAAAKPGGIVMVSTISRNWYSYLMHIFMAEYVSRIVPRGTHHHDKFINLDELKRYFEAAGITPIGMKGLEIGLSGKFYQSPNGANYMLIGQKKE